MTDASGVISGGWGFVWAAYALTAGILGGYAVSLIVRYRVQRRRQGRVRP